MKKKKTKVWNNRFKRLKMGCWNPWDMCNERFNYCSSMEFDILGLTELHNVQNKKCWKGRRWITSADAEIDEQGKNLDPAAGVGILLSKQFSSRILAKGAIGARIVWVRLDGPVCPLFVICAYIPHKYKKTKPCAEDTILQLEELLANCKKLKPTDCVILMGDFNCELQRNVPGCTGKWLMNKRPDKGHSARMISLMQSHDLFAADSLFRPKRRHMFGKDREKRVCNATYLQKDMELRPKKLDYFLISNRWRSCVVNSTTNWVPSTHRFGKAFDHSLLKITWSWRVKSEKPLVRKDFKAMTKENWTDLDTNFKVNMIAKEPTQGTLDVKAGINARLSRMNECLGQAIETCVPAKKRLNEIKRDTSDRTRMLYEKRERKFSAIAAKGGTVTAQLRKRWNRKIRDANLHDYNDWLKQMASEMEDADNKGDSEKIFRIVKIISGQMAAASTQAPSTDKNGDLVLDQQKLAQVWQQFLAGKFKATEAESYRDGYEDLGPQLINDPLTEQAFVRALRRIKKGKACGPDGIPAEVFYNCEAAARELYELLKTIWAHEYVPPELVRASFIMLFKNKGSMDDPTKYRCIGLLPHAYKILSLVMLERIMGECSHYLSDWQAGFRPERGCRDNILLLRVLYNQMISEDKLLYVTFIDYQAAFDSVSHKFLDVSLKKAGATRKTRAMFRAIYSAAEGTARVRGLQGNQVYSTSFKVRRGVIQGDIISPIFFILAMEQLFRTHDADPVGSTVGNYLHVGVLGYADDAALVSHSIDRLSQRLSSISRGSRADADMLIHTDKTKTMHVCRQEKQAPPQVDDIKQTEAGYKNECSFCGRKFKTNRGLNIHTASCKSQHGLTEEAFTIAGINAVFGTPQHRWFRVEWKGHQGQDSWEPERSLVSQGCEESIKEFWNNSAYPPSEDFIPDPDDIWRCWTCGHGFKTARSLKGHITRKHPARTWTGTTADRDTRKKSRKDEQERKEHVLCEGSEIENVWSFKYLGSRFSADGGQHADVDARIAIATMTAGKMRNIWASRSTSMKLKIRIYSTGVCSRLTYGSEVCLDTRCKDV